MNNSRWMTAVLTMMLGACESPGLDEASGSTKRNQEVSSAAASTGVINSTTGVTTCRASAPIIIGGFDGGDPFEYQHPPLEQCKDLTSLIDLSISGARGQVQARADGTTCHVVYMGCLISDNDFMSTANAYETATLKIGPGACPGSTWVPDPCEGPAFFFDFAPRSPE